MPRFSWTDILFIFSFLATPWILAAVWTGLLLAAVVKPPCSYPRIILKWLAVPQLILVIIFMGLCFFYGVSHSDGYHDFIFSASPALLGALIVCALALMCRLPVIPSLLLSHIAGVLIFCFLISQIFSNLPEQLKTGRELHQLQKSKTADKRFTARLDDAPFRQRMLTLAASHPDVPQARVAELLKRGASPFQTSGERYYSDDSPFGRAFQANNLPALRLFSAQLSGDSREARENRMFLLEHNPLCQYLRFSYTSTAAEKQNYMAAAKTVLAVMPSLANDEVYARALKIEDTEIVRFLWDYGRPDNPVYLLQTKALMGDVRVANDIAASPTVLTLPAAADYPTPLWVYLVRNAPADVIEAILKKNVVNWGDYNKDRERGENQALEAALRQAQTYSRGDPRKLTLVIKDMKAHGVTWSSSQIGTALYNEPRGSNVASALRAGGMTCQQLQESQVRIFSSDARQRINEVCGAVK